MHPLEPIVAHGSRMSWAGILRPGNEFALALRSQLAVITPESGPPVKRHFGKWDPAFRRFATNLTSPRIRVECLRQGERKGGIMCVLHWVDRRDMVRSDRGSVCQGDGWPRGLWEAFTSKLGALPRGSVAEKLQCFLDSDISEDDEGVRLWRARVRAGATVPLRERSTFDYHWLPVPATLVSEGGPTRCMVSWSPGATFFASISEALSSPEAAARRPDLRNQARYYLECVLSKLHGVKFGPDDHVEDWPYANSREVVEVREQFERLERERIAHPKLGPLDRFSARG